jgi:hypothetical protein
VAGVVSDARPRSRWLPFGLAAGALAAAALACAAQRPLVETRVLEIEPPTLRRIAVAPFAPSPNFKGDAATAQESGAAAADAAALTTRFVTEAFAAQGFDVVPAGDLVNAIQAKGETFPHGDIAPLARVAAADFGATALLVGEVNRYTERQGGELGATRPAGVGFTVTVYATSDARELWGARFDQTQVALSENLFEARRYPGGGSRWLSAAQLAQWGAEETAKRLLELR